MKFKFIAVFSIIIFCVVNSFAQERKVEIEISMEEIIISKNAEEIPVKVKITNKAEEELKTDGLGKVIFYFSKCISQDSCRKMGDIYSATLDIPARKLREKQSFVFETNLADFYWTDATNGTKIFPNQGAEKYPKNFKEISNENIYFYTRISLYQKKSKGRFFTTAKVYQSNTITVVLE